MFCMVGFAPPSDQEKTGIYGMYDTFKSPNNILYKQFHYGDLQFKTETRSITINSKQYNLKITKTGRVCVCNVKFDYVEFNGSVIDSYTSEPLPEDFRPSAGCAAALNILGGTASMEILVYADGRINLWSNVYKGTGQNPVRGTVAWIV